VPLILKGYLLRMIGNVTAAIILRRQVGALISAVAMSALNRLVRVSQVWNIYLLTVRDLQQKPPNG
jgi:hypothetical protein